jgi:hypothetical protein
MLWLFPCLHPVILPLNEAFAYDRYYCSKSCQVSDWQCHKEYYKSQEKLRDNQGSQQMQHALGCFALHDDGGAVKAVSGEAKDANGMTSLLRAASENNWREVRKIMLSGADPSVADGQGLTALHYAAYYGSSKLAQTLIEHGPAGLVLGETPQVPQAVLLGLATCTVLQ